jgi:hypothetical protein
MQNMSESGVRRYMVTSEKNDDFNYYKIAIHNGGRILDGRE